MNRGYSLQVWDILYGAGSQCRNLASLMRKGRTFLIPGEFTNFIVCHHELSFDITITLFHSEIDPPPPPPMMFCRCGRLGCWEATRNKKKKKKKKKGLHIQAEVLHLSWQAKTNTKQKHTQIQNKNKPKNNTKINLTTHNRWVCLLPAQFLFQKLISTVPLPSWCRKYIYA